MSRTLACWIALVCVGPLAAAGVRPDPHPPAPPLNPKAAEGYARTLQYTLDLMVEQYARPVERAHLVTSALQGLYEAAGRPAPVSLPADVRKVAGEDDKLVGFLQAVRESIGNPESLQGNKDLTLSLQAALRSLDPYCLLLPQEAQRASNGSRYF